MHSINFSFQGIAGVNLTPATIDQYLKRITTYIEYYLTKFKHELFYRIISRNMSIGSNVLWGWGGGGSMVEK